MTVLTVVETPVMKIPSLEDVPDADPVPIKVIGALFVVVIPPAAASEMPRLDVVVPLPVHVKLIPLPVAVVMRAPVPEIKIPAHPLVPAPPVQVPVMDPLVEEIFPPVETSSPLLFVPAFPPVPLAMMFPELVETVEELPLTTMPRLEFPPVVDAVPASVIPPGPVAWIFAAAKTPIPSALAPVPAPLPVKEI